MDLDWRLLSRNERMLRLTTLRVEIQQLRRCVRHTPDQAKSTAPRPQATALPHSAGRSFMLNFFATLWF